METPATAGPRLEGWKAIALYLGKDPRTALRWVGLGLPVCRVNGRNSSVYAYAEELEGWLRRRAAEGAGPPVALARRGLSAGRDGRARTLARHPADRPALDLESLVRALARRLAQATPAERRRARRLFRSAVAECARPGRARAQA